jgi:hypothetical protein
MNIYIAKNNAANEKKSRLELSNELKEFFGI